jgi:hypothetical protein
MALVPIEPLLNKCSPRQLLGIPGRQTVLVAEIAQDRIGLEDFDRAIDQRRNLVIRVDSQIGRRYLLTLVESDLADLILKTRFLEQGHDPP